MNKSKYLLLTLIIISQNINCMDDKDLTSKQIQERELVTSTTVNLGARAIGYIPTWLRMIGARDIYTYYFKHSPKREKLIFSAIAFPILYSLKRWNDYLIYGSANWKQRSVLLKAYDQWKNIK